MRSSTSEDLNGMMIASANGIAVSLSSHLLASNQGEDEARGQDIWPESSSASTYGRPSPDWFYADLKTLSNTYGIFICPPAIYFDPDRKKEQYELKRSGSVLCGQPPGVLPVPEFLIEKHSWRSTMFRAHPGSRKKEEVSMLSLFLGGISPQPTGSGPAPAEEGSTSPPTTGGPTPANTPIEGTTSPPTTGGPPVGGQG